MLTHIFRRTVGFLQLQRYGFVSQMGSRKARQAMRQQLIYHREPGRLVNSAINLKYLVPSNIFQEQVTIQQYNKILVPDKTYNHFQNSYLSINLDIAHNTVLRNTLIRFDGKSARIGRLLEVMDMIGGLVSYRHSFGSFKKNNPFTLVTGSVQSLEFFEHINTEEDILIQGFVNNTGRTSMEIEVNINQGNKLKANSYFTMVSRSSSNLTQGLPVPQLDISHLSPSQRLKAQKRQKLALQHVERRKREISQSFDVRPPNSEEIKQIHELFLSRKGLRPQQSHQNQIKISQTYLQTNGIMHLQDRNINGKVFGGYLMREMLETGWVSGMKFLKGKPFEVQAITDIYFLSPVEVGDGLTISAAVTYTQGSWVIVTVQASTIYFATGKKRVCCTCQLILQTGFEVKGVYPCSYEEAIEYLNSRRTFGKLVNMNESFLKSSSDVKN